MYVNEGNLNVWWFPIHIRKLAVVVVVQFDMVELDANVEEEEVQ